LSATERLSTLDEFGSRKRVIPAEVAGPLRIWRTRVHLVLLAIFLVLPWIKIGGLQALLFDIPNRRFEMFGILFLAHDAPLLFLLLMLSVLGLALVTAFWGRVWCGWACPQTVFIDSVYRRLELWSEGGYVERRRLHAGPMSWTKLRKVSFKWFLYFLVSSAIAHSFIAYFAGGSKLLAMMRSDPASNWGYFLLVSSVTALLMFNFGWFREQFCVIMCPYGRFQGVLMDQDSIAVTYDEKRGEPRKSGLFKTAAAAEARGDCVSCNRCVEVCPTGIDIRNGLQMECISCTACIDACNAIMRKVGKPEGLIRHSRVSGKPRRESNGRIYAYSVLAAVFVLILAFSLSGRQPYAITVHRATDTPFQTLPNAMILNHFKVHTLNQSIVPQDFEIDLTQEMKDAGVSLTSPPSRSRVLPGMGSQIHLFLMFPQKLLNERGETVLQIMIREKQAGQENRIPVKAVGPYSSGS
jgi:cytochrome c oxidase accessory protein FixG